MILGAEKPRTAEARSSYAVAQGKAQPQSDRWLSFATPKAGRGHKDGDHVLCVQQSHKQPRKTAKFYRRLSPGPV